MQSRHYLWGNKPQLPDCNSRSRKQLRREGKLLSYTFHSDMSVPKRSILSRTSVVLTDTRIGRLSTLTPQRNRFARKQFGPGDSLCTFHFDMSVPEHSRSCHNIRHPEHSTLCRNMPAPLHSKTEEHQR